MAAKGNFYLVMFSDDGFSTVVGDKNGYQTFLQADGAKRRLEVSGTVKILTAEEIIRN